MKKNIQLNMSYAMNQGSLKEFVGKAFTIKGDMN